MSAIALYEAAEAEVLPVDAAMSYISNLAEKNQKYYIMNSVQGTGQSLQMTYCMYYIQNIYKRHLFRIYDQESSELQKGDISRNIVFTAASYSAIADMESYVLIPSGNISESKMAQAVSYGANIIDARSLRIWPVRTHAILSVRSIVPSSTSFLIPATEAAEAGSQPVASSLT